VRNTATTEMTASTRPESSRCGRRHVLAGLPVPDEQQSRFLLPGGDRYRRLPPRVGSQSAPIPLRAEGSLRSPARVSLLRRGKRRRRATLGSAGFRPTEPVTARCSLLRTEAGVTSGSTQCLRAPPFRPKQRRARPAATRLLLPKKRYSARWRGLLRLMSARRLDFAPEGIDAGVELVRDLLEGLVGLAGHDLEARARDCLGDESAEARRKDDVELA
jgi:hypothetical protein